MSGIKDRLESEHARLEAEVAELDLNERESLSEASGENVYRDHMGDQGTATFERELDMTLEENVRDSLGAVHAALGRIEAGTYGLCERCSAQIPVERLEAVPTATMCIACKEADETR
ncbi:MAG: conjugal transfer protein TraR [Actinobacteria bacterium HGW-Actinobacteria-7]|nr:MAG: conjugal transfer protein TraR [Actinobacteria bacterium HGW-Actinobacteria-7]